MTMPAENTARQGLAFEQDKCRLVVEMLKVIAHPLRLRIVAVLVDGESHVSGLARTLGVGQARISQQLRILRMSGLIASRRDSGFVVYRMLEPHIKELLQCVEGCCSARLER